MFYFGLTGMILAHAGEIHLESNCYGSIMMGALIGNNKMIAADWKAQVVIVTEGTNVIHTWTLGNRTGDQFTEADTNAYIAIGQSAANNNTALVFRFFNESLLATHFNIDTVEPEWGTTTNCGLMPKIRTINSKIYLMDVTSGIVYQFNETSFECSVILNQSTYIEDNFMGATICNPGDYCHLSKMGNISHDQDFVKVWSFDLDPNTSTYYFLTQRKAEKDVVVLSEQSGVWTNITSDLWIGTVRETPRFGWCCISSIR